MSRDRLFYKSSLSPQESQLVIQPIEVIHHKYVSDKDMAEAYNEILFKRNSAIHNIEKEVGETWEMFKDANVLMKDQQLALNNVSKEINDSKSIAKNAENELLQAEDKQKRWCLIC